ncbi:DUF1489 family protein [Pseudovibrio exalbescens]|uniref:DUF1489 family protein n=1 Tax=Pseudovibrio exalbescens TaxID=197461 RepID=UPI0023658FBE|nr:DUF1489 family protein [Pseudovibrio exalbescens]MDD7910672.1 DUF1489 family protein [Pseudovibrio exalbescens]
MALHLVKLCVGVDSPDQLQQYIEHRQVLALAAGVSDEQVHTTRMVPTRIEELLDGGSLYWVIKGSIQVRQKLIDIRVLKDDGGRKQCELVLEPHLVHTHQQPRRPFQGWRYLKAEDAPADMRISAVSGDIPESMRQELQELCLI